MLFSTPTQYAFLALRYLAEKDGGTASVQEIAQAANLPPFYLSKILHTLNRAKLVESTRGPKGGFRLAAPAGEITFHEVVSAMEVPGYEEACFLGTDHCTPDTPCPMRPYYHGVRLRILHFLDHHTLKDLVEKPSSPPGETLLPSATFPG